MTHRPCSYLGGTSRHLHATARASHDCGSSRHSLGIFDLELWFRNNAESKGPAGIPWARVQPPLRVHGVALEARGRADLAFSSETVGFDTGVSGEAR